jgi:hypothetical protein
MRSFDLNMRHMLDEGVKRSDVLDRVPPALHDSAMMSLALLPKECDPVAVLVFGNDMRQVVVSGDVRKAMKGRMACEAILGIAVGGSFTREAAALLRQQGFVGMGRTVVDWTDESYQRARQRTL